MKDGSKLIKSIERELEEKEEAARKGRIRAFLESKIKEERRLSDTREEADQNYDKCVTELANLSEMSEEQLEEYVKENDTCINGQNFLVSKDCVYGTVVGKVY